MPYVSKTDRQAILSAALQQVARDGIRSMSLRGIADSLGLAPNALYRYFADRAALEAAMCAEGERQLYSVLKRAAGTKEPRLALRKMAAAYVGFARKRPHLYELMMASCKTRAEAAAVDQNVWSFVVEQVSLIAAKSCAHEAATSLWALLHGIVTLEAAQVFGEKKPVRGLDFGLDAWFGAAAATNTNSPLTRRKKRKVSVS